MFIENHFSVFLMKILESFNVKQLSYFFDFKSYWVLVNAAGSFRSAQMAAELLGNLEFVDAHHFKKTDSKYPTNSS